MVASAEQDEVVERGLSAGGPVLDVMRVDVAVVRAPGEPAAAIASPQGPVDGRGYRPRLAPDGHGLPGALDHRHDGRIASEAPSCLRIDHPSGADRRPTLISTRIAPGEPIEIDVDDHLVALASGHRRRALGEQRLGQNRQAVGTIGPDVLGPVLPQRLASGLDRLDQQLALLCRQHAGDTEHSVRLPAELKVPPLERELLPGCESATHSTDDTLELGRGAVARDLEQLVLELRRRRPGQSPHLRVAELAAGEGGFDLRQPVQRPRDAHLIAGRPIGQRAVPREPGRGRVEAGPLVAAAALELGEQAEPGTGGGVDVDCQLTDPASRAAPSRASRGLSW